jgi:glycosyltransferase involved in cell wall biosynthesis
MNILFFESFMMGSHKIIANAYKKYSRYHVDVLGFPGTKWERRICASAVDFADVIRRKQKNDFDLIVAVDLTRFGDIKKLIPYVPLVGLYHEQQLLWNFEGLKSSGDWNILLSDIVNVVASDRNFFESQWSFDSFFEKVKPLVSSRIYDLMLSKTEMLPLGCYLEPFDKYRIEKQYEMPVILWNHRMSFEKNPTDFFRALRILSQEGLDFKVIITVGNSKIPPAMEEEIKALGDKILHSGFVEDYQKFVELYWKANICVSTTHVEYFGMSVVEAMYCENWPILPARNSSFPEFVPKDFHQDHLFSDFDDFVDKLRWAVTHVSELKKRNFREEMKRYSWNIVKEQWDDAFEKVYSEKKISGLIGASQPDRISVSCDCSKKSEVSMKLDEREKRLLKDCISGVEIYE